MRPHEIVAGLEAFTRRGPGTDAERRAANSLARELTAAGADVRIDPFWCRPNWAFAHAWHVALIIAGSLVSVSHPRPGLILLLVALVSIVADAALGMSLGRRLTPERASQNVVARKRTATSTKPLRLVITANYDAGRTGLVYRAPFRRAAAYAHRATRGMTLGWLGWICLANLWLIVVAVLRIEHHRSSAIAITQFVPTALLVIALATLIDLATADHGPAANDNGSGAAVAVALTQALIAAPPGQMDVELVLAGAGEAGGAGLRRYLRRRGPHSGPSTKRRRRRPELDRTNAAVLAFAASGAGAPHFWTSDGSLVPLRYSKRFRQLCAELADETGAKAYGGRGTAPGYLARQRGIPAITLGCLDHSGLAPRSHQAADTAAEIEPRAMDTTVEFGLILVDALDSFLARTATTPSTADDAPTVRDPGGATVAHRADP
jgi:hypothetical protein